MPRKPPVLTALCGRSHTYSNALLPVNISVFLPGVITGLLPQNQVRAHMISSPPKSWFSPVITGILSSPFQPSPRVLTLVFTLVMVTCLYSFGKVLLILLLGNVTFLLLFHCDKGHSRGQDTKEWVSSEVYPSYHCSLVPLTWS